MNWGSLDNFLAMGGYGFYVWGAFGGVVAALGLEVGLAALRRRAILQHLGRGMVSGAVNEQGEPRETAS